MDNLRDQIIQTLLATRSLPEGVAADALLAIMSTTGGEAVAERSPKAPGGINWLCDVLPERGTKLYLHPAPAADDAVLRDAERYRWLRSEIENGAVQGVSGALVELYDETMYDDGDELDAAIDAAMAKEQGNAKDPD